MTENEVIEILTLSDDMQEELPMLKEVYKVAVNALKEVRQYRALGTVEEIKELKESALSGFELANIWAALEKLKKYEGLGTVEELREAREKQRAKKMKDRCPDCGTPIKRCYFHCPGCGQAIDGRSGSNRWKGRLV